MSSSNNTITQTYGDKSNKLLVIVFCVLIALPILFTPFTHSLSTEKLANENRLTASWPAFGLLTTSVTTYTSQVNAFFEDRFPIRQQLLDFYARLYFYVMQTGSGNKVTIGDDGWLYLADSSVLGNARGTTPLEPEDALDWVKKAQVINDTVNNYGGQFLVVIIPDKPQVYPEHLPERITYQREGRRADTLVSALEKSKIDYLDLLDPLLDAKEQHASPIYSKTDSHWSFVGALDAYKFIIEKLNTLGFDLPIVELSQLRIVNVEDFRGDLSRLLNLENYFYEDLRLLAPHRDKNKFPRSEELLLLGDSFAGNQVQFIEYSFSKTTCIHHDWGEINLDTIREQQADIVILQMVERGLEYPLTVDSNTSRPCGNNFLFP